jgi:hypothetical protein
VEIFYDFSLSNGDSAFVQILKEHILSIRKAVRAPFLSQNFRQKHLVLIAETTYPNAENPQDFLKI